MKNDVITELQRAIKEQRNTKTESITLNLTNRQMKWIEVWVKTGYVNEKMFDEMLGL